MLMPYSEEIRLPGVIASYSEQDDTQLVKASQEGDQDAFALLVQRHQRRVFNLGLGMLQDEEDASEATQEAFLAAWQGLPSFCGEACFATWLYSIAYHCCLRQLERRKRGRSLQAIIQAEQILEEINKEKQVETILEQRDRQALVREQLEHTPERSADRVKLAELYARMTEEFDRRARAAWADAMPRRAST